MKLSISEILNIMGLARSFYNELPQEARLYGMSRPMDDGERRTLSFLHGCINLLQKRGLLRPDVTLDDLDLIYEVIDSFPVTEGYETEAPVQKPKYKPRGPMGPGRP